LQIAVVGIPGTTVMPDEMLVWSEEAAADHHYVQEVLAAVGRRYKLNLERVGVFGFSQGAVVAADIASRYPNSYRGALLLSPGAITGPNPASVAKESHKQQMYVAVCGAQEHPMKVETTRHYAKQLRGLGAKIVTKEYEGMKDHTRPPDFKERFPEWASQILGLEGNGR
jgi:predicted esterase